MSKMSIENTNLSDKDGVFVCADCGSSNVETFEEDYTFAYGIGEGRVELTTRIPIRKCGNCGFSYRDCIADDICHEAVCRHLGVMTPAKIRALRELHGLTQAQFSEVTKLGEATLSRWERGVVIQNQAYDNYLYLLAFSKNFDRVRERDVQAETEGALPEPIQVDSGPETVLTRSVPSGFPSF
jgi:DNA-binding XRE family transcriptional regulator